jgi:hypothetical protein
MAVHNDTGTPWFVRKPQKAPALCRFANELASCAKVDWNGYRTFRRVALSGKTIML